MKKFLEKVWIFFAEYGECRARRAMKHMYYLY